MNEEKEVNTEIQEDDENEDRGDLKFFTKQQLIIKRYSINAITDKMKRGRDQKKTPLTEENK